MGGTGERESCLVFITQGKQIPMGRTLAQSMNGMASPPGINGIVSPLNVLRLLQINGSLLELAVGLHTS